MNSGLCDSRTQTSNCYTTPHRGGRLFSSSVWPGSQGQEMTKKDGDPGPAPGGPFTDSQSHPCRSRGWLSGSHPQLSSPCPQAPERSLCFSKEGKQATVQFSSQRPLPPNPVQRRTGSDWFSTTNGLGARNHSPGKGLRDGLIRLLLFTPSFF